MTHNDYDIRKDVIQPISQFFIESNIVPTLAVGDIKLLKRPFTIPPEKMRMTASKSENALLTRMLKQQEIQRVKRAQEKKDR